MVLLKTAPLFAQFDFPPMAGSATALGGAHVALTDEESALFNVAGLANMESPFVSMSVRHSFIVDGIGYASVGAAIPVNYGSWALNAVHYGNTDYNEQQISFLYAMPIGDAVSLGAAFYYLHSATSDPYYDPLHRFTFAVAMQYYPTELITVGFKAYNPIAVVSESSQSVRTPSLFNLGVSYRVLDELLAVVEVEKNLYHLATLRFGLQYEFLDDYAFRIGLNTQPVIYSFGFGMQFEHFGADLAVQIHNVLGTTSFLSAHYRF